MNQSGIAAGRDLLSANPATANFMIVLTDGEPTGFGDPDPTEEAAAARAEGTTVFAVGVGEWEWDSDGQSQRARRESSREKEKEKIVHAVEHSCDVGLQRCLGRGGDALMAPHTAGRESEYRRT